MFGSVEPEKSFINLGPGKPSWLTDCGVKLSWLKYNNE